MMSEAPLVFFDNSELMKLGSHATAVRADEKKMTRIQGVQITWSMRRVLEVVLFLLLPALAMGAKPNAELEKLSADVKKAMEAKGDAVRKDPMDRSWIILNQLQMALVSGEPMQLESALQQAAVVTDSEDIRAECLKLLAGMRAAREVAEQRKLAQIEASLRDASATVRAAKTAADLDETLRSLNALLQQRDELARSSSLSTELNNVQMAVRFVSEWQNYLAAVDTKNFGAARSSLESLSRMDGYAVQMVPRSEVLLRWSKAWPPTNEKPDEPKVSSSEIAKVLDGIKSPQDIAPALLALNEMHAREDDGAREVMNALKSLDDAYRDYKAGLATQVEFLVPQDRGSILTSGLPNPVPQVRAQILCTVLPRYLGLPKGMVAKPGEIPAVFLARISAEAAQRGDYELAARADDTASYLATGDRSKGGTTQAGIFVAAQNQERAGQFAFAVTSYQRALALPCRVVPPEVIGKRLADIKAAYPKEYQQGIDCYFIPPSGPAGTREAMMQMMMRQQQMGGRPPMQSRPELAVPPAKTKQTAKPTPTHP